MNLARFYLLAIALHLAVLFCFVASSVSVASKPKYLEVILAVDSKITSPPLPILPLPEVSPVPADQAGLQLIEQPLTNEEPPPSLRPNLPPPEPPPPASAPDSPSIIAEKAPVVKAPPGLTPSLAGSNPKNQPGPLPKIASTENGAPNGNGTVKGGGLPFGGNPHFSSNGHFYEAVSIPTGITWLNAQKYALLHNGHLVTITSAAENQLVFNLIDNPRYWRNNADGNSLGPWIGGYKSTFDKQWYWVNSEGRLNAHYTHWCSKEPDNTGGNQDHLHYYSWNSSQRQATWDDQAGNDVMNGFVIEYELDPTDLSLNPAAANSYIDPINRPPPPAPVRAKPATNRGSTP